MGDSENTGYSYVKGCFLPEKDAVISIKERGFRFGDGVFETISVHEGVPYQWERHENRLLEGLKALKITADLANLQAICKELLNKTTLREGFLRISVSRGIGSQGYLPVTEEATLVIETTPAHAPSTEPIDIWLSSYQKIAPNALPIQYKTMQGLNSTLARLEAQEHNCFEALLLNDKGHICEGSSSNIFWFRNNTLYTPALANGALAGTIREALLRLSPYPVREGTYTIDTLQEAEEVWFTNVAWQVMPVRQLLPQQWQWQGTGKAQEYQRLLQQDIAAYTATHNGVWI